jgi:hypothetical protein
MSEQTDFADKAVMDNARSPELGAKEVAIKDSVLNVYGFNGRTVDFDPTNPGDDAKLREGLAIILTNLVEYSDLLKGVRPEGNPPYHKRLLDRDNAINAIAELQGKRPDSTSLIVIMPIVSELARFVEKAEYLDMYGNPGDPQYVTDLVYGLDLRLNKIPRRVQQEERIKGIEEYVTLHAPGWADKAAAERAAALPPLSSN